MEFEQLPPDQPLYIMYSSGTTGLPKCMVQSTAGILINQMKEMRLNTDLKREDTIFYFTTCGWMMWNWLTSALSIGATLVLYDGNPFYPDASTLWKMAEEEKITVFGTSAGYLQALEASGIKPGALFDLRSIRTILSTGSPLSPEQFDFVHRDIKEDVQLASISGGSDLNGCFVGANPIGPVFRGELQARCLGMKVKAYNENGEPVIGEKGELVCEAPFPSMPIYFWNDPDGSRYQSAYFDKYPNIWCHGDYINITDTGGVVIHGRSDATLNPGGVRIGTAEIYRQIESFDEIQDSVVVGQKWKGDVRVILFVLMKDGYTLTDDLKAKIRTAIKLNASPRHIPSKIIAVEGIPYTLNMKKVEVAVRKVIHNEEITNRDALSNPEALEYYKDIPELQS
ncbi:acetoacetate--CoA ligase [Desulfosarcina cetonica]|uniref:acetoacetate--CoA ligase n=1 Tax=Desulfosarcina cetonica TaxID=90730 RepID=UPI00248C5848|nr:acetoacetate--CoA ligase [Desulfosarcina cetonica]